MPVPSTLADLSTTAASNSPPGSESVGNNIDNYFRAHAAFIAQLNANKIETSAIGSTVQAYDADIPTVSASQAEMEAGTEAALRSMSPLRVKQAIDALYTAKFSFAGVNSYTTDTTLTLAADGGKTILIGGGTGRTITLPLASASDAGMSMLIFAQATAHTIARQGSDVISIPATVNSFSLSAGEWIVVTNYNGTDTWVVTAGTLMIPGIAQTWQDMSGSRAFGQNYNNGTARPIAVSVGFNGAGQLITDGGLTSAFNGNSTALHGTVYADIPPGGNYQVVCAYTMDFWMELR